MARVVPLRPLCLVVAVDARAPSEGQGPLRRAFAIASHVPRSELHVVTVASDELAAHRLTPLLRAWAEDEAARVPPYGTRSLRVHVLVGDVADELASFAEARAADLLAIGERRRRFAFRAKLADRLARSLRCPVLVTHEHDDVPVPPPIVPPCAACIGVRRKTGGERIWCAAHTRAKPRAHRNRARFTFSW